MKPEEGAADSVRVFQAPRLFLVLFYGVLLLWTIGTIPPIFQRFRDGGFQGDWLFGAMIAFFYGYTWFWALGLFHRVTMDRGGRIRLNSIRGTREISAEQVRAIEGSRFPGGVGFVRLKLPRESAYLFCHRIDGPLGEIFRDIRERNPLIRTVRI